MADIRTQVVEEIARLTKVLALLDGGSTRGQRTPKKSARKKMSAAARAKIGAAQRARWAKVKKSA